MMIDMRCPHCGTAYRLKQELAGRQVKCRACQEAFTVEEPEIADDDLMSIQMPAVREPSRSVASELPSTKEFSSPRIKTSDTPPRPPAKPVRKGPKVDELGFLVHDDEDEDHHASHQLRSSSKSAAVDPHDEAELLRQAARKGAEALYEPRKPKPKSRAASAKQGPGAATVLIRLGLGVGGIAVAAAMIYFGVRMLSSAGIRAALAGLPYEIQAEFEQSSDTPIGSPAPDEAKIDKTLTVGDLSKHRSLLKDMIGDFNAMANALGQINDEQSAQAAKPQIDEISRRLQNRLLTEKLRNPNPKENRVLAQEYGASLRSAAERIRDQLKRIQANSSFPLAMSGPISQMNMGISRLEREFITKGEIPAYDSYAEIRVAGLKNEEERAYVQELINELASPRSSRKKTSSLAATRYAIWPVESLSQLSRSINFGKVIRTSGKEIWVVAEPISKETLAERRAKRESVVAETKARAEQAKKENDERAAEARRASGEVDIPKDADDITRGLLMATRSTNSFQRKQGLDLLKRMPKGDRKAEVLAAMETLLDDSDPFIVKDVIEVIKKCDVPGQFDVLHKALKTTHGKNEAVEYLAEKKSPESIEPLVAELQGTSFDPIVTALVGYGPSIEAKLIPFLSDHREPVRKGVCMVLAAIGGDETLAAMKKLPPDSSFFVRNTAAETITRIQSRKVLNGDKAKEPEPKKYETTGTGKIVISPNRKSSAGSGKASGPQP